MIAVGLTKESDQSYSAALSHLFLVYSLIPNTFSRRATGRSAPPIRHHGEHTPYARGSRFPPTATSRHIHAERTAFPTHPNFFLCGVATLSADFFLPFGNFPRLDPRLRVRRWLYPSASVRPLSRSIATSRAWHPTHIPSFSPTLDIPTTPTNLSSLFHDSEKTKNTFTSTADREPEPRSAVRSAGQDVHGG